MSTGILGISKSQNSLIQATLRRVKQPSSTLYSVGEDGSECCLEMMHFFCPSRPLMCPPVYSDSSLQRTALPAMVIFSSPAPSCPAYTHSLSLTHMCLYWVEQLSAFLEPQVFSDTGFSMLKPRRSQIKQQKLCLCAQLCTGHCGLAVMGRI